MRLNLFQDFKAQVQKARYQKIHLHQAAIAHQRKKNLLNHLQLRLNQKQLRRQKKRIQHLKQEQLAVAEV